MSCIAVGNFDGVHRGHLKIMKMTSQIAKKENTSAIALTFDTNTKRAFNSGFKYITDKDTKRELLLSSGIDKVEFLEFTPEIMSMSGKDFIKMLISSYGMSHIVCGDNFRFGHRASCGIAELKAMCDEEKISCTIVAVDGISSTAVRKAVSAGNIELANELLGHDFCYKGKLVGGNRIGRTIGFPTLNSSVREDYLLPPNGVYATYCVSDGEAYPAVTNIGTRPTVTTVKEIFIETHLIGLDRIPEGKEDDFSDIRFLSRIRDEKIFPDTDALAKQISADCEYSIKVFRDRVIRP